ncbi:MAG: recombinase family protein [Tissierellia bacterium]|nr:recombinase family protein [Tissierellia bacterium]
MKYAYIRVSTKEQNIERQLTAMKKENLDIKQIYVDKSSGKDFNRKKYKQLIRKLKEGDELYIKSIDRLGRNYDEIIEEWNRITKEKKADIIVIDFPLLDTREKSENLTGKFLADIVLQILSYVAQIERENTHQRQMEGIMEAKKKGVKFGRPKNNLPDNFYEIATLWKEEKITLREGARRLNISHSTFSRKLREYSMTKYEL